MDDIKKRAEQYAHSYPFAKVADAYEVAHLLSKNDKPSGTMPARTNLKREVGIW